MSDTVMEKKDDVDAREDVLKTLLSEYRDFLEALDSGRFVSTNFSRWVGPYLVQVTAEYVQQETPDESS